MKTIVTLLLLIANCAFCQEGSVLSHHDCQQFSKFGINIRNISAGATEFEVWRSSIGPHARTPKHWHDSEEVFVFYQGKGIAHIGDREIPFEAPCTLVLPPGIEHQIINTESEPTDHVVIIKAHSKIYNSNNEEMGLPWRFCKE